MKTLNMNEDHTGLDIENDNTYYGRSEDEKIKNKPFKDGMFSNVVALPVGYVYKMHWGSGIDWDHTMVVPSPYAKADDTPIII